MTTDSFVARSRALREERDRKLRVVPDPPAEPFPDGKQSADPFDSPGPADPFDAPRVFGAGTENPGGSATADQFDAPGPASTGNPQGYAQKALTNEVDRVHRAGEGTRNDTLNRAAFSLGQLVAGGELTQHEVIAALTAAARSIGLTDREIGPTINSGLSAGATNPRTAPRDQILRGVYQNAEQAAERWEEPEPIEGEGEPPAPFPVAALPDALGAYVGSVAANKQVPVDLVALTCLTGLSTAALNRVWISGGEDWIEPVPLWTLAVLESGARKSPVMREISRPFYALERLERAEAERAGMGGEDRLAIATKQRDALILKASKVESKTERDNISAELDALRKEIDEFTPAPPKRWLVDDTTAEALARVMAENDGYAGVLSAEGGLLETLAGRYSKGQVNFDVLLKAHDGEPIRVDRVTRDPLVIDQPALAMALAVQPDVLAKTAETPALKGRGFMGRFLFAVPEPTVGTRGVTAPPIPPDVRDGWDRMIGRLAGMPVCQPDEPQPTIQLHRDAVEHHWDFRDHLEPRMHRLSGDLAFMADFVSKLPGKVLRIAALLHLAGGGRVREPLSLDTMAAAVEIGEWALTHAVQVYGGWRAPEEDHGAVRLLEWIRRTRPAEFVARDAQQALKGQTWVTCTKDIKDAIVTLVEAGWLASVERHMADGKRRLREGIFVPHPRALGASA
ncbi:YfjI family protein [Micromonosporaceae bacterium B7E4]